ncbi:hypothetical protein [Streptomyces sp. NPDC056165]|uniref:hypothetical protein n=1 Tax=Streptomyces sp. NPDC056165 TaxID=3345733 RepID=UPI0035E118C4
MMHSSFALLVLVDGIEPLRAGCDEDGYKLFTKIVCEFDKDLCLHHHQPDDLTNLHEYLHRRGKGHLRTLSQPGSTGLIPVDRFGVAQAVSGLSCRFRHGVAAGLPSSSTLSTGLGPFRAGQSGSVRGPAVHAPC